VRLHYRWRPGAGVFDVQTSSLNPGDIVDVVGFPAVGDYTPSIHEAIFRKLGLGPPPAPRPVSATEALSGDFDGDLVRIDGRLIAQKRITDQDTFLLDSGGTLFSAILQADPADARLRGWRDGSQVRLTGICTSPIPSAAAFPGAHGVSNPAALARGHRGASAAVLVDASARAVRIWRRGGGVLCVLFWVAALKRRVQQQTSTIQAQLEEAAALKAQAEAANLARANSWPT